MQVTLQFFERDHYVGTQTVERQWNSSDSIATSRYWPNTAYWCQDCGEIWARVITQADVLLPQVWGLVHRRCPEHGAGTLLLWTDLDGADKDLLTREFLVSLEGVTNEHSSKYFARY